MDFSQLRPAGDRLKGYGWISSVVDSGIIRLRRNNVAKLDCNEKKFKQVVKAGFNQRRKTLRNALKPIGLNFEHELLNKRADQLGVADFVLLTNLFDENFTQLPIIN